MRLGVMQPYFFPYLGYFQLIAAVDKFLLYDHVHYIKKGWVHRNRILEKWREPVYCAAAVQHASSFVKIRDVRIDNSRPWREKLLQQLWFNYKNAPHFDEVYALIDNAVPADAEYLTTVNAATIIAIARYLGITTSISTDLSRYDGFENLTSDEHADVLRYYRETRGLTDIKTLRVLHLCACEQADTYINPIGGRVLYDKTVFANNGVALHFVETTFSPYRQYAREFIPALSILDVLMHCGQAGTRQRLDEYRLV